MVLYAYPRIHLSIPSPTIHSFFPHPVTYLSITVNSAPNPVLNARHATVSKTQAW